MAVIWELDFYSRPLLDENQKKLWEVLICESPLVVGQELEGLFQFSKLCANTEVNSVWLRTAVQEAIAQAPNPPDKIRFFRRQMTNMIIKGCEEAGIRAYSSRRTIALNHWLEQRMAEVYPSYPNYQASPNPSVLMGAPVPRPLPDQLIGQQWAFVTLEAKDLADMPDWEIDFGEAFPLELVGLSPEMRVPGVLIFSPRALPLAAWMSGLELASIQTIKSVPPQLLIETGSNEAWVLATLTDPALLKEAENFEAVKKAANNVHFVGVQSDPDAERFTGFWLLQELNLA